MSKIDNGGPAFPRPAGDYNGSRHGNSAQVGMTLRDYLAAKAMQALLSTCDVSKQGYNHELDRRALQSYLMADAMLKARNDLG